MNIMNAGQLYQFLTDSGVTNADTSGVHLPNGMILGEVQIDTDGANGPRGDYYLMPAMLNDAAPPTT
jgi:hypothetical protein